MINEAFPRAGGARLPLALLAAALCACPAAAQQPAASGANPRPEAAKPAPGEWQPMFDGKTLDGWKETDFAGNGKVSVENGSIVMAIGAMTGVNYVKPFPKTNYEVRYRAARTYGYDFFGALTFPVGDAFLTFINGGWGGSLVGLSSLDDEDASENETGTVVQFENNKWYLFRIRVTDQSVEAWIDDKQIVGVDLEGRKLSLRPGEIEMSAPFGFATYSTTGAIRDIEYRLLPPDAEEGAKQ
jgi:hypothetical protein